MSSRHDNRHTDGDGGGGSLPYVEYEDRDSHYQKKLVEFTTGHEDWRPLEKNSLVKGFAVHNSGGDNERLRTTEPDRGNDKDRRRRNYLERSGRDERGRERNDDNGRGNRDYSRRHGYDRDRGRQRRHRSRSASPDRSRETSRSRSKSKRTTGFDMAPPTAATLPGAFEGNVGPHVPLCYPLESLL